MSQSDEELYFHIIRIHQLNHITGSPYTSVDKSCPICHPPVGHPLQRTQYFLNILNTYQPFLSYTSHTEAYLIDLDNYIVYPNLDYLEGAKITKKIVYTLRFRNPASLRIEPAYKFIFLYTLATESFSKDLFSVSNPIVKENTMNQNQLQAVIEGIFGIAGANITGLTTQLQNAAGAN